MIDEYWTWMFYGYYSDELSYGSGRSVVARCDRCCQYRISRYAAYHDLCGSCVQIGRKHTDEAKQKISKAGIGKKLSPFTDEAKLRMSKMFKGKKKAPFTEERRRRHSATLQGIPYEEWTGFSNNNLYCKLFNEACKERIRAKYDHRCYICDKPQDENVYKSGKHIKLSVHHVDKNRNQGCDGVQWKLVPLCASCHTGSHYDPVKSRLEYLLDDEDV